MTLDRLGASHQTRLSFMRVLLRQMRRRGWRFDRPVWKIDADGTGHAVYRATGDGQAYSLVAFAHDLPDQLRSDRVIAEAWDATFTLFDGTPTESDIARLAANVPRQEAGRVSDRELVLSRANRSVRLWDHVIDRLSQGLQPDPARVAEVGYLMRTTAVYGSGKFGAADHAALAGRPVIGGPFRAEMLAVWFIRAFVLDLVEHIAVTRGRARAARLDPELRRQFGIGNSTGLGMAPFLVNHPTLINAWVTARETALARVRGLPNAEAEEQAAFLTCLARARRALDAWACDHPLQRDRLLALKTDAARIAAHLEGGVLDGDTPWNRLMEWAQGALSVEGQEWLAALMLEPYGALVDDLADGMGADEIATFQIDGTLTVADTRQALARLYDWALDGDADDAARFWYVSEAKLEPRLGERDAEPGAELEMPLDIARAAAAFAAELDGRAGTTTLAEVLETAPQHRRIARRVQMMAHAPYGEIRGNLLSRDLVPFDMLRCKLAFFGATRFDPRSDRWLRITMFQNAPFPHELSTLPEDDWILGPPPADSSEAMQCR
jgi:hypothetical protein